MLLYIHTMWRSLDVGLTAQWETMSWNAERQQLVDGQWEGNTFEGCQAPKESPQKQTSTIHAGGKVAS